MMAMFALGAPAPVMVTKLSSTNLEYIQQIQCRGTPNAVSENSLDIILISARMRLVRRSLWKIMCSRQVNQRKRKSWFRERKR